jgi:SAM-dependent methyltransferase
MTVEHFDRKQHWEKIYHTKMLNEVSWYQPTPQTSLDFLEQFRIPLTAKIIDVGGGDGFFIDHLLELGYTNVTVLDISEAAIERAKIRLGERADDVKWIIADAADFVPPEKYDFWHDRAAFHFLTNDNEIRRYIATAQRNIHPGGIMVVGTFSETGPLKCSGIEIRQYSETSMTDAFGPFFEKIRCITVDHVTPFQTIQNFTFCSFRKTAA